MKRFEVFLYVDRLESNGQYIGKTRTYIIEAEDIDKAETKAYKENPWARGCWCQEVGEIETYGIEFSCKCYGNHILSEERVFIEAKSREQAIRYYNNEIKGKRFNSWNHARTSTLTKDGDVECGPIQQVYLSCGRGQYNATNY